MGSKVSMGENIIEAESRPERPVAVDLSATVLKFLEK
jgi:hypothetical protein